MSLDNLPDISFCDTDTAKIEAAGITMYEGITGRKLYPGDPERLFLEGLLALISQQRVIIDQTGKMNLLRYAVKDFLDHKGAMTDTPRLDAHPALTQVTFSIEAPLAFVVTVAKGTQVTPDGKLLFATTEVAEIAIGATSVSTPTACTTAGVIGNGFVAGQINRLVGSHDYITAAANTTTSNGGADEEADPAYRDRVRLSPERLSTAGPDGAYEFWAKSAHQDIIAVAVYSPAAMQVEVRPLLKEGALPTAEILAAVEAEIGTNRLRRPLTDQVTVLAPEQVAYGVAATYYIDSANSVLAAQIQTAAEAALASYLLWQRSSLGRDINPSYLTHLLMLAGAKRITISSPAFQVLEEWQVAAEGTATLTYGGLEDE